MSASEWFSQGLDAFDTLVAQGEGLRERPGQRHMAEQVARAFADAELGRPEDEDATPRRAIAVVQAGTGVGKSLAYSAPAIAIALARNTRVVISTATVALQEQLVNKDLPALAARMPQPFKFALAKGRGRYVCNLKLERLAGGGALDADEDDPTDDLFAEEEAAARARRPAAALLADTQARMQYYAGMQQALASGAWDGDRDSLDNPPEPDTWIPVAAEAASCTGKHCPAFHQCAYYERRKELVAAQVIVANHDLLLSSLGARLLPEPDNCLLVLDEAHHLPSTALDQFACAMVLGRAGWLDKLSSRALRVGMLVEVGEIADIPRHAATLRQALEDTGRIATHLYGDALREAQGGYNGARVRLPRGELPEPLQEPLQRLAHHAEGLADCMRAIAKALKAEIRDKPQEARRLSTLYAQVGMLAPRLEEVLAATQLLLQDCDPESPPIAKWFTLEPAPEGSPDAPVLRAHASPVQPGSSLRHRLWSRVRAATLTSATLTSCGQFDFFLREAGLHGDEAATTLAVASPFDYAQQGALVVAQTVADPRQAQHYTAEMVQLLVHDLDSVASGALVLFTSREQMRQAVEALPARLRPAVLVQNSLPRWQLLRRHRERVEQGEPSIIFGMQSFGEGLDLPGALCETLFITKLPFAPPDDPVGEARAEWLRTAGRDPFSDLVVPATAIRLAQWVGRAIRTEDDRARVVCYDRRLTATSYGQRLLQGLPPFAREPHQPPQTATMR